MRLKVLETTASENPDLPFQAGQIVTLRALTPFFRQKLKAGVMVLLRDEPSEHAVVRTPEQASR